MNKTNVPKEWQLYFNRTFGENATFESVAQRLNDEIVENLTPLFFRQLQNIKELHATENGQYRDYFGDWIMSQKITLDAKHDQVLTPYEIVDFQSKSTCELLNKNYSQQQIKEGINFIDPFCGTGRFMLGTTAACITSGIKDYSIYCVDIDMRMVAYCITNALLHNVDCHVMLGDVLDFRIDRAWRVQDSKLSELGDFEYLYDVIGREPTESLKQRDMITVIIGNPPYNVGQQNENDNNKNRKYKIVDGWVKETYAKASKATLKNALSDPYVKAVRWSSERIKDTGIVALVTNNGFLDGIAFDGMRQNLAKDFSKIYTLDLGGNVRKNPKLSGTTHNVFGIQVGVSINLLVKKEATEPTEIYYARLDEFWKKKQKYEFLELKQNLNNIEWQRIEPDKKQTWLQEGLHTEFNDFVSIGTKEAKAFKGDAEGVFFKVFSSGITTGRDNWTYNFNDDKLGLNLKKFIQNHNYEVMRFSQEKDIKDVDSFVNNDPTFIKWTDRTKKALKAGKYLSLDLSKNRNSLYRPFCRQFVYFDELLVHRRYKQHLIFPTPDTEKENKVISIGVYGRNPFALLIMNVISDLNFYGDPHQCFPFYTYSEDGTGRTENITDWIFKQCQNHYKDKSITKWDIFYYVYGLLHHPQYRTKYAANLKRELPRLPLVKDFRTLSSAGKRLADIHLNYESQPEYELERVYNQKVKQDLRVEKMRLSKDKTQLRYNDFLTLKGIPAEALNYRLGNRSALDWIVDQYRVKVDKRSGIENDPNQLDDPQYILRLIGQIITVSLDTVKIVKDIDNLFK